MSASDVELGWGTHPVDSSHIEPCDDELDWGPVFAADLHGKTIAAITEASA